MGFPGPEHIIRYLGRYSHRVAITNQRITEVSEQTVSLRYKDYRDGKQKNLELTPKEFTQRFLLHVLPKRFAKIRHFGILANRDKTINIERILHSFERRRKPKSRKNSQCLKTGNAPGILYPCPLCQKGHLIPVEKQTLITHTRGSPWNYRCLQNHTLLKYIIHYQWIVPSIILIIKRSLTWSDMGTLPGTFHPWLCPLQTQV